MSILARISIAPTEQDRLRDYQSKFNTEDESHLYRVAKAIAVQKKVCERLKQIPRHRALVVIHPQAKTEVVEPAQSNIVYLPTTGQHVEVIVRKPKQRLAR